jgi:hypothetical protein
MKQKLPGMPDIVIQYRVKAMGCNGGGGLHDFVVAAGAEAAVNFTAVGCRAGAKADKKAILRILKRVIESSLYAAESDWETTQNCTKEV